MPPSNRILPNHHGFTLIEISIVLVIIGLVIGGVMMGKDLIEGAAIRSQISQIEKYNAAVHTFRLQYNALPGDMNQSQANSLGFVARGDSTGIMVGAGDGNGIIQGYHNTGTVSPCSSCGGAGENVFFWNDLTWANGKNVNLIEGTFRPSGGGGYAGNPNPAITGSRINLWFPRAKVGNAHVYVYSYNGENWFGLSNVTFIRWYQLSSLASVKVSQAYAIDAKVDDGLPQAGKVIAYFLNWSSTTEYAVWAGTATTAATAASATTCYDNANVGGAVQRYSMSVNGGNGANCGLSFKFQ
ncbi:MAG: prepilin-type N-terminal cleavage/methylation domain-containing protein [Planctomycetaceae bacterium]|nr:prepilin-type N-terminal cleavage/methylation domain-containing protein [Planctomycetaceae bacterium]